MLLARSSPFSPVALCSAGDSLVVNILAGDLFSNRDNEVLFKGITACLWLKEKRCQMIVSFVTAFTFYACDFEESGL